MSHFIETQKKIRGTPRIQTTRRVGLVGFLVAAAFLPVGASPRVLDSADVLDSTQRGYFSQGAEPAEVFDNALGLTPGQAIVYHQGHFEVREGARAYQVPAERLSENLRKRDHQGLAAFIQQGGRLQVLTYTDGTYGLREFLGLKGGGKGFIEARACAQINQKEFQKKYNDPAHSFEREYKMNADVDSVVATGAATYVAGTLGGPGLGALAGGAAAVTGLHYAEEKRRRGAELDAKREQERSKNKKEPRERAVGPSPIEAGCTLM